MRIAVLGLGEAGTIYAVDLAARLLLRAPGIDPLLGEVDRPRARADAGDALALQGLHAGQSAAPT